MNRGLKDLAGEKQIKALVIFIIALLLFPSSPSILCIAPGSHVAIEDIYSPCCASAATHLQYGHETENGFYAPGGCHDCTDLWITTNGLLPQSEKLSLPLPDAAECLAARLVNKMDSVSFGAGISGKIDSPPTVFESAPLRC